MICESRYVWRYVWISGFGIVYVSKYSRSVTRTQLTFLKRAIRSHAMPRHAMTILQHDAYVLLSAWPAEMPCRAVSTGQRTVSENECPFELYTVGTGYSAGGLVGRHFECKLALMSLPSFFFFLLLLTCLVVCCVACLSAGLHASLGLCSCALWLSRHAMKPTQRHAYLP